MIHSEVVHRNWFQRIKEAVMGVPLGIVFIIAATWGLIYGEKNHAKTTNLLKHTEHDIQIADSKKIDPSMESQLILVSDSILTNETLTDTLFNVQGQFINLYQQVKMYQWEEKITHKTHDRSFGRTVDSVSYEYKKVWSTELFDSDKFKYKDLYKNPRSIDFKPAFYSSKNSRLGAYHLDKELVAEVKNFSPIAPSSYKVSAHAALAVDTFLCLGREVASNAAIYSNYMLKGEYLFKGKGTPQQPEIGDYKFVYWAVLPSQYSIIAEQKNNHLQAKTIEDGFAMSELNCGTNFNYETNKFMLIHNGSKNLEEMFSWAHEKNDILFIIGFRLWGFIFMVAGFKRLFKPLAIMPTWVPIIGNYSGKVILRASFLIATTLTFLIAGVTWLIYNNVDNITRWDYYFLILVVLISIGAVRVGASMGEHSVDSGDFFDLKRP